MCEREGWRVAIESRTDEWNCAYCGLMRREKENEERKEDWKKFK